MDYDDWLGDELDKSLAESRESEAEFLDWLAKQESAE